MNRAWEINGPIVQTRRDARLRRRRAHRQFLIEIVLTAARYEPLLSKNHQKIRFCAR